MKRTLQALTLMSVFVIGLLVLAACAPPPPPAAAPAAEAPAADAGAPADATEAAGEAPAEAAATSTELNVLCTPQVQWCEGMKAEFEKAHPDVTVNFVRMSSGEALARLRAEKDNPQFDVWWGGPVDGFIAATGDGLLEPYTSPNMDNLRDQKLFRAADDSWAGVYVGSLGFGTNKNWLAENPGVEAPKSWEDLLKPEFKGQIMVAHPSSSGTSYTALCTILQLMGEEKGWEFIQKYAGQVNQFTKSGAAPANFVGQGEAAVGIVFSHDIVAAIENGSPLELTFPAEGTGYEIGGVGLIKGAKHPDTAKMWIDWALEPATQELGPKYEALQAPTVNGAQASRPELLDVKLIEYDFNYCGTNKSTFVDKFTNEIAAADKLKE
jgi:iron(III) transport system substrate-binding protein